MFSCATVGPSTVTEFTVTPPPKLNVVVSLNPVYCPMTLTVKVAPCMPVGGSTIVRVGTS
jgi:hypothetical protein